jgi:hypothetical protein
MTVKSSSGKVGTKIIKTSWPVEQGLILGTTKLPLLIGATVPEISDITKEEGKLR